MGNGGPWPNPITVVCCVACFGNLFLIPGAYREQDRQAPSGNSWEDYEQDCTDDHISAVTVLLATQCANAQVDMAASPFTLSLTTSGGLFQNSSGLAGFNAPADPCSGSSLEQMISLDMGRNAGTPTGRPRWLSPNDQIPGSGAWTCRERCPPRIARDLTFRRNESRTARAI